MKADELVAMLRHRGLRLATAESCTGGMVAAAITDIAGSSDVFECGFVTYSNAAKNAMLGVDALLIEQVGAVSKEVAMAMARGALAHSSADVAVAVTGIAGPGGGSPEKPVGLVHFASLRCGGSMLHRVEQFGDLGRATVRLRSVAVALDLLETSLRG